MARANGILSSSLIKPAMFSGSMTRPPPPKGMIGGSSLSINKMNIPYLPKSFHGDVPQYSAWEIDIFRPAQLWNRRVYCTR